jgi:hypothetical protein
VTLQIIPIGGTKHINVSTTNRLYQDTNVRWCQLILANTDIITEASELYGKQNPFYMFRNFENVKTRYRFVFEGLPTGQDVYLTRSLLETHVSQAGMVRSPKMSTKAYPKQMYFDEMKFIKYEHTDDIYL